MEEIRKVNILIAASSELFIEPRIVREVCLGLNESDEGHARGITFESATWKDVFASEGDRRDVLDRLISGWDVLVCILHKRCAAMQGPGPDILEEFLSEYQSWKSLGKPHFMFYFKKLNESSLQGGKEPEPEKVFALRENIKKNKIIHFDDFSAPNEFCEKIYDHLITWACQHDRKAEKQ